MGGTAFGISTLAGRAEERRILKAAIDAAAEGQPRAVLMHGEAGVGKTRLTRYVCHEAASNGMTVLWGQCVRFGAADTPYAPLVSALEGWADAAEPWELSDVVRAVPVIGELLPSMRQWTSESAIRLMSVVDELVHAIASQRSTVLVVDDLQWADLASRDALAYLVAGFRNQRLAVLTTHRDEELVAGHPLNSWLADLTRLPAVTSLPVDRLNPVEVEEQLSMLLGGRPHPRLVAEVVQRSDGNPYLSELLVQGVTLADEQLPAELSPELTGALLAAWHRLSPSSRDVMRIVAVGGRPVSIGDLAEVAATRGVGPEALTVALVEATNNGICVAQRTETSWFRHPLLAEVLYGTFVPGEAMPIHAAWATMLESRVATGIDEVRRQGDLALHHERAHNLESSIAASLRAADLAGELGASREEAVHLGRATRLWSTVHGSETDRELSLLERLARASSLIGDGEAAYAAWCRAHELIDERIDPLQASRIELYLSGASWNTGRTTGQPVAAAQHAADLSRPFPDSQEYGEALAYLSTCQSWNGMPQAARRTAEAAVEAAHRSGAAEALTLAYEARALAFLRDEKADGDSAACLRFARMTESPLLLIAARTIRGNYLEARGRVAESTEVSVEGLREAIDAGALGIVVGQTALVARDLLMFGRLPEASQYLREGLSLMGTPFSRANVRLMAALLSVRRGDLDLARQHLRRATELIPDLEERPALMAPPMLAEYLLARRYPDRALDLLSRTLMIQSVDSRVADDMLMWSARSAADLCEQARDRRDDAGIVKARRLLDEIVNQRSSLRIPPFEVIAPDDLIQPAMQALFAAEHARCAGGATPGLWRAAVQRCGTAELRWEEAVASVRLAQTLLDGGERRTVAAEPLRSAHRFAVGAGALSLQHRVEALASIARIPLAEPVRVVDDRPPEAFRSLTKRELEVLSHLAAGRTYAEIAAALFISEKTVSVHVSNLLRKTGTSTGREVAALATRLGYS